MNKNRILQVLEKENLVVKSNIKNDSTIKYISHDSRDIIKDTLFFCKGINYKKEYLDMAIESGANIYISEKEYDNNCDYIIVNDIRKAMAIVALEFYDYPAKKLKIIGITGTKGKTTTAYFLRNILNNHTNSKIGFISTVETYTGKRLEQSHLTTPEPLDLQKYFSEMVESNIEYVVMEVTSQAYKLNRVYKVLFDYGIFLNISEDHIGDSEHKDFKDYLECKLKLIDNTKLMIINKNMDYYDEILNRCNMNNRKTFTYSTNKNNDNVDYYSNDIVKQKKGFSFDFCNKDKIKDTYQINVEGRFNVENATVAIALSQILNIDKIDIKKGLLQTQIEGRMNIFEKDGVTVVVDYAHNELSFKKLYESLKLDYPNRKIISVGGAPGNKAYKRRESFGTIVGDNSNFVYITADDPQYEKISDINTDILKHMKNKNYKIIEDRKEAILEALESAKKGDIVVLLAKGEELYQKVNGEFIPYESDLALAKKWEENIEISI